MNFAAQLALAVRDEVLEAVVKNRLGTFGEVFFVSSDAANRAEAGKKYKNVFTTITGAIGAAVASRGDVILVDRNYAETVTAAITVNKIGVSIIGLGEGSMRPTITPNGAIDAVNVTAAGVTIENIRFAAPETTLQTADINIAAAGVTVRNTYHIGSKTSKYKVDMITITSAGDDFLLDGVRMYNTVDTTNTAAISVEGACARGEIRNCFIAGEFATGVLMDEATATLLYVHHNTFKNVTAAVAVVTFTTGNSTGVFSDNKVSGRHTTFATNIVEGTGMDFFENYVVEEAALSGIIHPAVDAD